MSTKYTQADIEAIVHELATSQDFRDRNATWREDRRLVFRERAVTIPGTTLETEYRTPDLLESADKYTARFLGAPITINVSAQGPGPKAEAKAQAMENFDYRLVSRWMAQGVLYGPVHDMCGVTGQGWTHLTLNRAILPIIPQRDDFDNDEKYLTAAKDVLDEFTNGERSDLFVLEPVTEPETIYYTKDRGLIMMRAEVPLGPLQREYMRAGAGGIYGERGKGKGIDIADGAVTVTTIEGGVEPEGINTWRHSRTVLLAIVETADYVYHCVEGIAGSKEQYQVIGCYKNVFGAPGFVPIDGRKTNHPALRYAVHPLTHAAIAIAPQHNILSSIIYSGGILGEMQRVTLEPLPGDEAAQERRNNKSLDIELIGNRVVKFPDGYRAVQPNIGVNADTLNAAGQLEAKMMQYGYPLALGQPESVDASSGYQQAVMRDTVASVLDPPLANIAANIAENLRLKDTGIKTLGVPVTFRNFAPTDEMGAVARAVMDVITIDPEDIVEVDRSVTFDSLTQYARQAKIEMGRTLLGEGRITEDMFLREYVGVDDPARLKRQRLIEKAQLIAEELALKATAALVKQLEGDVSAEAITTSGLAPFAGQPAGERAPSGTYTQNGAGGPVPLEPAPPSPESAMGQMGSGNPGAMG